MTDDESVKSTEDEQLEVDDTSFDEEFDDVDASFEEETSTEDESSAEESEESTEEDVVETKEEVEEESQEEPETKEEESTEEDTTSESPEEAQKRFNDEMAKRRIAEKQLREERKAREEENLNRYLQEAEDDEIEYARRELQVKQHRMNQEQSALTQEKLQVGIDKAIANIDLFRTGTPELKEELAKSLDDFERMYVEKDQNGNYVKVNADVYQYLQDKAESLRKIAGIGARQQVKQKAQEKARTVKTPVKSPKPVKVDSDLEAFDEEANRW